MMVINVEVAIIMPLILTVWLNGVPADKFFTDSHWQGTVYYINDLQTH